MTFLFKSSPRLLPIALSCLLGLCLVEAAGAEGSWRLQANYLAIDDGPYDGDHDLGAIQAFTSIGHDDSFGLSLERRFTDRLGLQLSAFAAKPTFGLAIVDTAGGQTRGGVDTLDLFTLTLGLTLHLTPNHRADVYVEPLVGMMNVEDMSFTDAGETLDLEAEDEMVVGLALGVAVPIKGSAWSFQANLRYLDFGFDLTAEDGAKLQIDYEPIVAGLGVGFRF